MQFSTMKDIKIYNLQAIKAILAEKMTDSKSSFLIGLSRIEQYNREIHLIFATQQEAIIVMSGCKAIARFIQESPDIDKIYLCWENSSKSFPIIGEMATEEPEPSLYGTSILSPNASEEAIADFLKSKEREGFVVTVTSMTDDRCLNVNRKQGSDRGKWRPYQWIGIDFKKLWIDSFEFGRRNYYGELKQRIQTEKFLPGFEYEIRRPSGALARYSTDYYFANDYLGCPVRIAVSKEGNWYIVESAADGSE